MDARLLFITSHYFTQPTRDALDRLKLPCETKVIAYDDFAHIASLYDRYADQYDVCFTSGVIAKQAIEMSCSRISKPLIPFQISPNALHRDILRFVFETQSTDFSRIAMDFLIPLDTGWSVADFLRLEDIEPVYAENAARTKTIGAHSGVTIECLVLDRIIHLWKTGQIDLVICQYSSIVPRLQELGIPYRCSFVSDRQLYQMIQDVLIRLELSRLHNNHPAIIQIFPRHAAPDSARLIRRICENMQQYIRDNMIDCVIQESSQCCTLITTMQLLRFLTDEFQVCRISCWLEQAMDFPITVGYGVGTNVTHAMNNAQIASKEAMLLGKSFIVETNGSLIGPLNSDTRMIITSQSMPDAGEVAHRCGLSAMTIQRLMSIVQSSGSDKITTQELANKLNTTVRNANRILLNLCRGDAARPVYSQASHSRGRPIQVYQLDFGSRH